MADHGAWYGKPIVSEKDWRKGTEYGGVEGMIAPLDSPHKEAIDAGEQLMLMYNTNPTDASDNSPGPDSRSVAK